ncbi:CbiX/SirB N-terminal domain-containing protein, partial [Streptomyces sp. ME03-5709C]|nr:CbiX/SirB N-terminal domain-containing protein [Streptomyces sp. ME03-5709C]
MIFFEAAGSREPGPGGAGPAGPDQGPAPGLPVRLGHIEIDEPPLDEALAAPRGEVVLVPLMLTRGHHVERDIPGALARAPHLHGPVAAPPGPHPLLAEALHDRLAEAGRRPGRPWAARREGVVPPPVHGTRGPPGTPRRRRR